MVSSIQIIKLSFLFFNFFNVLNLAMIVCEMNVHSSSTVTMFELFKIFIAHEEAE